MAKDRTEVGITGKLIPKPRTPKQQYELEKKRRQEKHLGKNVGGTQYRSDVTPYYNPRARTFEEFVGICEKVVYGGEKKEPEDTSMTVTASDRKANTTAWQNYLAGHKGYKAAAHLTREETETQAPPTPEERRKVKKMQQLARLKQIASAKRYQSDVAREEYEVDEAARNPSDVKLARTGFLSRFANQLEKDIEDATQGKKKSATKSASRKVTRQTFVDRSNAPVREESEIDEIHVLTPIKTKSEKKVETSKPKRDPYGETPEDYRKRMKTKQQKEAINYDLEARQAADAAQRYKEAKARKLAKRTSNQQPLRKGEVRRYNPETGKYESNLD
jgi:hypothetical protein